MKALNSSSLAVMWEEPNQFNGPPPEYTVIQSEVAFSSPPPRVVKGTRFPGGGYYLFPPETIPQGVAFTGRYFCSHRYDMLFLYYWGLRFYSKPAIKFKAYDVVFGLDVLTAPMSAINFSFTGAIKRSFSSSYSKRNNPQKHLGHKPQSVTCYNFCYCSCVFQVLTSGLGRDS